MYNRTFNILLYYIRFILYFVHQSYILIVPLRGIIFCIYVSTNLYENS